MNCTQVAASMSVLCLLMYAQGSDIWSSYCCCCSELSSAVVAAVCGPIGGLGEELEMEMSIVAGLSFALKCECANE